MKPKIKFISRVIDGKTGKHYLDAIDEDGKHWTAELSPGLEPWLVFTKQWTLAR